LQARPGVLLLGRRAAQRHGWRSVGLGPSLDANYTAVKAQTQGL
jgi:hypothetical protein